MKANKVLTIGMMALMAVAAHGGNPELPLNLNSAGDFVILAKTGISTVPSSDITGDMGVSPITASAITGFSLMLDTPSAGQFSTSAQVDGKIYASDYAVPTPTKMTAAISDMESAFTAAALRPLPDTTEFMAGNLSGQTMTPGLHKWSTGVLVNSTLTLDALGDPNAIFIFQISGDLNVASSQQIVLAGGAQARNIFWQVDGPVGAVVGTYAHVEGVILTSKAISLLTGATFNGKLLAQTRVDLDQNVIMDSNLILPPPVTLTLISEHGVGTPLAGRPPLGIVYTNAYGAALTNGISLTEVLGTTQYVNTGWSMIGNEPASGIANTMGMTHTNDAVLTWNWSTNYYLSLSAVNGSIVSEPAGWKPAGWIYSLSPVANTNYVFDYWIVNGASSGAAIPLGVTMGQAQDVVAVFRPLFIEAPTNVLWSVAWTFDPRKGYYLGTLTIDNTSTKIITAPVWFEVQSTEWHWLRSPTGLDDETGLHYVDISAAVGTLNPGQSASVTGIELMGRRTADGILMALWADPPGPPTPSSDTLDTDGDGIPDAWEKLNPAALSMNNPLDASLDSDRDGMTNGDEYVADTDPADSLSLFTIRTGARNARVVVWNGSPDRVYTVWGTTDLRVPFTVLASGIPGGGAETSFEDAPDRSGGSSFYRVEVDVK